MNFRLILGLLPMLCAADCLQWERARDAALHAIRAREYQEAEKQYERAIIFARSSQCPARYVLLAAAELATVYIDTGRFLEAEKTFKQVDDASRNYETINCFVASRRPLPIILQTCCFFLTAIEKQNLLRSVLFKFGKMSGAKSIRAQSSAKRHLARFC